MPKLPLLCMLFCICFANAQAQNTLPSQTRLKVFVDCSNTWCDMSFIRSEINIVDFLLDNQAADVHLLITEQSTGSGGSKYQLIYFGQNNFKQLRDTLHFATDPNATDFEIRDQLIKYMKLGLTPYVVRTGAANEITISFKTTESAASKKDSAGAEKKDPWNYWVYRVGADGNLNADAVYRDNRFSANLSANRTTEQLKVFFSFHGSKNKSAFTYEDQGREQKIVVRNHNYGFWHYLIQSINSHWSYGYELSYSQNTFSNFKGAYFFRTAFEYNIFPYKEVNNRYFAISYGPTARTNRYYDTTIFNKQRETLFGHQAEAKLSFNQKWGTIGAGINYHHFFHDWKLFNLSSYASTNIRITGGLSFYFYINGALTRDQINLPKGGATEQEILTRRRQIASGYNFYTSFGLNYRFGSKLNNFVNPRFEGPNN